MNILLSFRPINSKRQDVGPYFVELINDSNFSLSFALFLLGDGNKGDLLYEGLVEPGIGLQLGSLKDEEILKLCSISFQAILLPIGNIAELPSPLELKFEIDTAQFRKANSYENPIYSKDPAFEVYLIKDGQSITEMQAEFNKLRESFGITNSISKRLQKTFLSQKLMADCGMSREKSHGQPPHITDPIEIDLHINSLLDSTAGMDNTAMLSVQLGEARKVMRLQKGRTGRRIIFIHGIGEGVLKKALRTLIAKEFPKCQIEDAPYNKYGFGATLVIIR